MKIATLASAGSSLLLLVAFLPASPSLAAVKYTSTGVPCTIVGTEGDNVLTGTSGSDVICGLGGNDTLSGGDGNDTIDGGSGTDTINGGIGNDGLIGGTGNDTINGGDGVDYLVGGDGSDVENGGAGNDTVNGGIGNDTLDGGDNNDTLDGGDGLDSVIGGTGNDTVSGGVGNDTLDGGIGNDYLNGGDDADVVGGGNGIDTVNGGTGNDTVNGGAGNDTMDGGTGDDIVNGGDDVDVVSGGDGIDTVNGGTGNDTVNGGPGNDTMDAGDGNDTVNGGTGNDTVAGGSGTDVISGGDGNDTVNSGVGNDTVNGGAGNDTIDGGDGNDTVNGDLGADSLSGSVGDDSIVGGDGNDSIFGGTGVDTESGGTGSDYMNGGTGNDVMSGGDGTDTLNGGDNDDSLSGDAGADKLNGDAGLNTCSVDESDTFNQTIRGFKTCDIGAPRVSNVHYDKVQIDTADSSATVVMTFDVTDDLAGLGDWGCWTGATFGSNYLLQVPVTNSERVNSNLNPWGNPLKISYIATFVFPRYSAQGNWVIGNFDCRDNVNNQGRYSLSNTGYWTYQSNGKSIALSGDENVAVVNIDQKGIGDEENPTLVSVSTATTEINTNSGSKQVSYVAHITDDIGLDLQGQPSSYFQVFGTSNSVGTYWSYDHGTAKDSYWVTTVTYPRYYPQGQIQLNLMSIRDLSGKEGRYGYGFSEIPTAALAAVNQTGIGDTEGPRITSIKVIGDSPDTRTDDDYVTLEFTVLDNLSGALWSSGGGEFQFVARNGGTSVRGCLDPRNCPNVFVVDEQKSNQSHTTMTVRTTFKLNHLSPTGWWDFQPISIPDAVGNRLQSDYAAFSFYNG